MLLGALCNPLKSHCRVALLVLDEVTPEHFAITRIEDNRPGKETAYPAGVLQIVVII
jgi:hypothetical protein